MSPSPETQALFVSNKLPFPVLPFLYFGPKVRIALQLGLTILLAVVAYCVYTYGKAMFDATGSTGMHLPSKAVIPGWIYVVAPLISLIAGAYVFIFLRFNFLQ